MIVCPSCRALLVQVRAAPDAVGQFICGCAQMTWVYHSTGDLERVAVPARARRIQAQPFER